MRAVAIIVAAGRGQRLGAPLPKCLVKLVGRPMLWWSVRAFASVTEIESIVVVAPPNWLAQTAEALEDISARIALVPGGEHRPQSVQAGLKCAEQFRPEIVAIHDGARPLVEPGLIRRCLEAAAQHGAAIAAAPSIDTLKLVRDGLIVETLDRREIWRAQTPQCFKWPLIVEAYSRCADFESVTDDAELVQRLGVRPAVVESPWTNLKVTLPEDLAVAEVLLRRQHAAAASHDAASPSSARSSAPQAQSAGQIRVGFGFDAHRFCDDRPLVLGGIKFDYPKGLAGHSDADVVLHAVADALLGAAGLGDIGMHFPDSDPQYAGADSAELLGRVVQMLAGHSYRPASVDVTVIAQEPKIGPVREAMRQRIAEILRLDPAAVSVKATTTEGMGFTGRREGIAAAAVAVIQRAQ